MRIAIVEGSGRGFLSHYSHALALGFAAGADDCLLLCGQCDELADWPLPFAKRALFTPGLRGWLRSERALREWRPDVVHLQWVDDPWLATLFVKRWRNHGWQVFYTPHNIMPHRRRWHCYWGCRTLYRSVDRVVARDRQLAWCLEEVFGLTRKQVTFIGGSPNLLAHASAPRRTLAELPARRPGEVRWLFFGHGSPRKGLNQLLDTLSRQSWPDCLHLVLAGQSVLRGTDPAVLAAAARRLRITIVDRYVEPTAVASLFREAELLLLPYAKLCKSPVTDLAAALRLPVVRTDRVAGSGFVDDLHGWTLPAGDPLAYASALRVLLQEPQRLARLRAALARLPAPEQAMRALAERHRQSYLASPRRAETERIAGSALTEATPYGDGA